MWFIWVMAAVFVLLFAGICFVDAIIVKEKKDPVFKAKMNLIRQYWKRFEPIEKVLYNLFWWGMAIIVLWYFY